jgi:hypothetical protein
MIDRVIQTVKHLHQGELFELLVFLAGGFILLVWSGVIVGHLLLIRNGWQLGRNGRVAARPAPVTNLPSAVDNSIELKGAYVKGTLIGFPQDVAWPEQPDGFPPGA